MQLTSTRRARHLSIASSVTALAMLAGNAAHALDWDFAPRIEVGGVYNDNYLMSNGVIPEREVSGAQGAVALDLTARGQLTETRFVPEIRATYFPDDDDLDSTDKYARFDWRRKGERSVLTFGVNWSDQIITEAETPSAETPDPVLGQSPVIGSNRILAGNNRQMALGVAPTGLFDLTERTRLDIRADYVDVDYEKNVLGNQVDYRNAGGQLGLEFATSQRSTLAVRGLYAEYQPDGPGAFDSNGYGLELLYRIGATERDQFYIMGGAQQTEFDTATGTEKETNFRAGIGAERSWTVTRMFVDAMYGVDPSATGSVVNRALLNFRLSRDFTQRTTGRAGLLYINDDPVGDDVSQVANRQYASAILGLTYRLSRQFGLSFDYTYTWQDFDDVLGDAMSNAVVVSLVWEPGRRN